MTLLDPKNDYVFKRLMTLAPDALVSLINAVRGSEPPIEHADLLNPGIAPDELDGKFIVLDILARDAFGRSYNIEMQVNHHPAWPSRSVYYLARLLAGQLNKGEDYDQLRPAIGIHLLDFDLFRSREHGEQAVWCFELRDRRQPALRLGEALQLNLIELRKADRLGLSDSILSDWVAFLEHWREDRRMTQIDHPPIRQAMDQLRTLSADDEARRLAQVRERALRDERWILSAARDEARAEGERIGIAKGEHLGIVKGERIGIAKGRLKGEAALLERLLTRRFGPLDATTQARVHSASREQLERWSEAVLDAPTLAAVFDASQA